MMKTHNLIISTLFAGLVFLFSIPIQAKILFDSTTNSIFDLDPVSEETKINASFTTHNKPIRLSFLTLFWHRNEEHTGVIHIYLLEDNNGYPGAVLDSLVSVDTRTLALGDQWLAIPLTNTKELSAKTRYWIQITAAGASGFFAFSREKFGDGVLNEFYMNKYGLRSNAVSGPYLLKLEGDENFP
jgi:hypothetical protein